MSTALHELAAQAGLSVHWSDAGGRAQTVSDASLRAILAALGLPAGKDAEIEASRARLAAERRGGHGSLITADIGKPIRLPPGELTLESGHSIAVTQASIIIDEPGYHKLETAGRTLTVAVAPPRAWTIGDAAPGRCLWGAAVQIPSLTDARNEAFGDFGALARFAASAAKAGADAVAVSPVHALFPADADRFSPYAPSTRLFTNALLADPSLLGDANAAPATDLIDWHQAIPARLARLRALFDRRTDATRMALAAFAAEGGEPLALHTRYDALHAHFFGTAHRGGWQAWPADYHDPHGAAVADFAEARKEEVAFVLFLQWLADLSLAAAHKAAKDAGMAIGLIADLAVGMDAGGSQAWAEPHGLLRGLSVGAPPDPLGPDGQDWGITTFSPIGLQRTGFAAFLGTIRAALRHAGGIRIDHAMGLKRLWVVPHGANSTQGAYLAYPQADMMRLLTLESWRHKAIVVGEDLGTVPPGFRAGMEARGMLGMRVLWFERTKAGGFKASGRYSPHAAAMTSTHDLPTVAGWWSGRDIDWSWDIGRTSSHPTREADHADRALDRTRLWKAIRRAGITDAPPPPPDQPGPAVDAAVEYVGRTPCDLAIIPAEDLLGVVEQPNLPGTIDEHPNWRRRLPVPAETAFDAPDVAARVAKLNAARGS